MKQESLEMFLKCAHLMRVKLLLFIFYLNGILHAGLENRLNGCQIFLDGLVFKKPKPN